MASTYLSRTNTTPTSAYKYTFSAWVKRGELATRGQFFRVINPADTAAYTFVEFTAGDLIGYNEYDGGVNSIGGQTNAVYRDSNAWYHIVFAVDTTQATGADRGKLYVNGVQITSLQNTTTGAQNQTVTATYSGKDANVGGDPVGSGATRKFGGLMAHVHFCDGYTYDASAFGETDATTGIWKPKTAPSVTYGTNGFFLKFENSGSMGTDSSGNANNFTVNGTMTQTIDTPSNVFATGNPLAQLSVGTLSNGNNTITGSNTTNYYGFISSTLGMSSGKYYAEFKKISGNDAIDIGISDNPNCSGVNASDYLGVGAYQWSYGGSGNVRNNGSSSAYGNSYTDGDIVGVALDLDNNKLYFSKNGTWQNSGDPESGATGTGAISITAPTSTNTGIYHFAFGDNSSSSFGVVSANFGNGYFGTTPVASAQNPDDGIGIFEFSPPTGYKALCTKSINAQEYA